MGVKWELLVVKNTGLGSLRGHLTTEGKLFVENTPDVRLGGFMPEKMRPLGVALKNPDNALIVAGPKAFVGEWRYEGRDLRANAYTHPTFIFSRI
jgi:hypothetical protein